jgi:hypothetical protein
MIYSKSGGILDVKGKGFNETLFLVGRKNNTIKIERYRSKN